MGGVRVRVERVRGEGSGCGLTGQGQPADSVSLPDQLTGHAADICSRTGQGWNPGQGLQGLKGLSLEFSGLGPELSRGGRGANGGQLRGRASLGGRGRGQGLTWQHRPGLGPGGRLGDCAEPGPLRGQGLGHSLGHSLGPGSPGSPGSLKGSLASCGKGLCRGARGGGINGHHAIGVVGAVLSPDCRAMLREFAGLRAQASRAPGPHAVLLNFNPADFRSHKR